MAGLGLRRPSTGYSAAKTTTPNIANAMAVALSCFSQLPVRSRKAHGRGRRCQAGFRVARLRGRPGGGGLVTTSGSYRVRSV